MRARIVAFPIKGRNWCVSRSIEQSTAQSSPGDTPTTLRNLWKKISSESKPINANAELVVDFISEKMNRAWMGLEKAPQGSMKNKLHGVGLRLLAHVKPSEIFLKSITKDVTALQLTYPSSLDSKIVHTRLQHMAFDGKVLHKKFLIGSATLLPLTSAFMVMPLPNIPFFWVLFRTYSHWRALQGSEKLLELISDKTHSQKSNSTHTNDNKKESKDNEEDEIRSSILVWHPSKELDRFLQKAEENEEGLDEDSIDYICKLFQLNKLDVLKYRNQE